MTRRQAMTAVAALWATWKTTTALAQDSSVQYNRSKESFVPQKYDIDFNNPDSYIRISLGHDTVSFTAAELMSALKEKPCVCIEPLPPGFDLSNPIGSGVVTTPAHSSINVFTPR